MIFSTPVKFDLLKVGSCQHPECVALRGGGRRAIDFPALVGLIEHPRRGLLLYDTGYSKHFQSATRRFPECLYRVITPVTLPPEQELLGQLESRGIAPKDIETIFISHFHADHVAGLRDFPAARFVATGVEYRICRKLGRLGRLRRAHLSGLLPRDFETRLRFAEEAPVLSMPAQWEPFREGRDLLGDESLLGIDLPGHTASQLGLALRTVEDGAVFLVGDACWKIEGLKKNCPPSRLAYALFHNGRDYDDTFRRLHALHSSAWSPDIIPSHCSTTWTRLGGTRRIVRV
jgi:glyoxylase-like metal-dependent hydrolase (beta-lactamase superfamily II)